MDYKKLNKNAVKCMFIGSLIGTVILGIAIAVALLFFGDIFLVKAIGLGLLALSILYTAVSPKVRYERYRYLITEDSIYVREGFIFVTKSIVPIERLHKITVEKGPIDTIFGLSNVIVTTAGGDVEIAFLEDKEAEAIAASLKNKINEIVRAQKQE